MKSHNTPDLAIAWGTSQTWQDAEGPPPSLSCLDGAEGTNLAGNDSNQSPSAQSSEDRGDLLWVQTLTLVNRKSQIPHSWSKAAKMFCSTDECSNTDLWSKMWSISSTVSANTVLEFNITEATLVSKGKDHSRNKANLNWRGIEGHIADKYWQQVKRTFENEQQRSQDRLVLQVPVKVRKLCYDPKGKRGPKHDPLPSAATT